jgi:hypothetical protein
MGNRGPQPLPLEEKRVHRFHVHVNELELDQLERVIGAPGLAELVRTQSSRRKGMRLVSDLMRAKLLGHRAPTRLVVPELNQRVVADLGRLGSNVNQIAHQVNSAARAGASVDIAAIAADLHELRDALQDALLGMATSTRPRVEGGAADGIDFNFHF